MYVYFDGLEVEHIYNLVRVFVAFTDGFIWFVLMRRTNNALCRKGSPLSHRIVDTG